MRKMLIAVVMVVAGITTVSVPLLAHHGNAAYETATQVTVKGTVTEWYWANPHCFLKFDVKDAAGAVVNWVAEVSNPPDMVRAGWTKTSFKAGDDVTVVLVVAKNNLPVGRIRTITLADGQVYSAGGAQAPAPGATAPRP